MTVLLALSLDGDDRPADGAEHRWAALRAERAGFDLVTTGGAAPGDIRPIRRWSETGPVVQGVLAVDERSERTAAAQADVVFQRPRSTEQIRICAERVAGRRRERHPERPLRRFVDIDVYLDAGRRSGARRWDRRFVRADEPAAFTGTTTALGALLEHWHRAGAEGFRLRPASATIDFPLLVDDLAPELVRRGLRTASAPGGTLRQRLGLPPVAGSLVPSPTENPVA
jgi:hypothetical protein